MRTSTRGERQHDSTGPRLRGAAIGVERTSGERYGRLCISNPSDPVSTAAALKQLPRSASFTAGALPASDQNRAMLQRQHKPLPERCSVRRAKPVPDVVPAVGNAPAFAWSLECLARICAACMDELDGSPCRQLVRKQACRVPQSCRAESGGMSTPPDTGACCCRRTCARDAGSSPSSTFSGFRSPCTSPWRCMFATAACGTRRGQHADRVVKSDRRVPDSVTLVRSICKATDQETLHGTQCAAQ